MASAPPKIDRQTTTPFHLKLFYKTSGFHRYLLPSPSPPHSFHSPLLTLPPKSHPSTLTKTNPTKQTRRFHPHNPPPTPSPDLHLANLHPPRTLPPPAHRPARSPPHPLIPSPAPNIHNIHPAEQYNRHPPLLPPHLPRHAHPTLRARALHCERTRQRDRRRRWLRRRDLALRRRAGYNRRRGDHEGKARRGARENARGGAVRGWGFY